MRPTEVDGLPLHDAVLEAIEMSWKKAQCTLRMSVFLKRTENAKPCKLRFFEVTQLHVPRIEPWGSSVFVNGATFEDGAVKLEMQSGDTIEIAASRMEFGAL
jgi:hypothetical protein